MTTTAPGQYDGPSEDEFANMFTAAVQISVPNFGHTAAAEDGKTDVPGGGDGGGDSLIVSATPTTELRQNRDEAEELHRQMRDNAMTDTRACLQYLCAMWPDVVADPLFVGTVGFFDFVQARASAWLWERATRTCAVTMPRASVFTPGNIYAFVAQSRTHLLAHALPDISTIGIQWTASACAREIFSRSSSSNNSSSNSNTIDTDHNPDPDSAKNKNKNSPEYRAVCMWSFESLATETRQRYIGEVRQELNQLGQGSRSLQSGSGGQRHIDLAEQLEAHQDANTETLSLHDASHSTLCAEGIINRTRLATSSAVLEALSVNEVQPVYGRSVRNVPTVQCRQHDGAPVATAHFRYSYVNDTHSELHEFFLAERPLLAPLTPGEGCTGDILYKFTQHRIAKEREYGTNPAHCMAGKLLGRLRYGDCRNTVAVANEIKDGNGIPSYETTRYDVAQAPAWRLTNSGIPLATRDVHVAIDEVRTDTAASRIYIVQCGRLTCYDLETVQESTDESLVMPLWALHDIPVVVEMVVSRGWIALSTIGGNVVLVHYLDGSCYTAQFRAPLISTLAWQAPEKSDVPGTGYLWLGQCNGHLAQLSCTVTPAGLAVTQHEHMWSQSMSPVRQIVCRGQHVVTRSDFSIFSTSLPHAFGGGLPTGVFFMHGITDIGFSGRVLAAQRIDGTVYLLDLLRHKLDTTMDQLAQRLRKSSYVPSLSTRSTLYFDGDYLRASVLNFSTLQATIRPL